MRTAIKVMAIFGIVIGALTLLSLDSATDSTPGFLGGLLLLGWGIIDLVYLTQTQTKIKE